MHKSAKPLKRSNSAGKNYAGAVCGTLLSMVLLAGCEAQLNLDSVNGELAKSSVRTDQYLTMTATASTTILLGSEGVVLLSQDEGQTWQRQVVDAQANFIAADVCPDDTVVALSFDKRVWLSTDDANTWSSETVNTSEDLQTIACAPGNTLWLTGSFSTLLSSDDRGKNWSATSMNEDALLTHVQFFSPTSGVAAGEFGVFFKTSDGGESWQAGGQIGEEFFPIDVWFRDKQTGWAAGLNGVILHTNDGGDSWQQQETESESAPIYAIVGNDKQVFALGDHGTALMLRGEHWRRLAAAKTPVYFSSGRILNKDKLLVAGGWGTIAQVEIPSS